MKALIMNSPSSVVRADNPDTVETPLPRRADRLVRWFKDLSLADEDLVGGKGANLGELTRAGLPVPDGFVLTAAAYLDAVDQAGVRTRLRQLFDRAARTEELSGRAAQARDLLDVPFPDAVSTALIDAYRRLGAEHTDGHVVVAVRSSAAGEDSASASFAGMNETFTNITDEAGLASAVRACWVSLYGERVVHYRAARGLHSEPAIAVVVQRMVNAARSGVMFTRDPTGASPDTLIIEAAWGQGEVVVAGEVEPDAYVVQRIADGGVTLRQVSVGIKGFQIVAAADGGDQRQDLPPDKVYGRVLDDATVLRLAELGLRAESHYGRPQDMEWCIEDDELFIVQSRPITTLAPLSAPATLHQPGPSSGPGEPTAILSGLAASHGIGRGVARVLSSPREGNRLAAGEVLVATMTKPDWLPIMRRAAAVVTDGGGVTCHAAIVSRELGIPCIVGARTATTTLRDGEMVTVDADRGKVYAGSVTMGSAGTPSASAVTAGMGTPIPTMAPTATATKILVNIALVEEAERAAKGPVDGVGLLRAELLVIEALGGRHPRALLETGRGQQFVTAMSDALIAIGRAFGERPVTYRTIDFRTNEFRDLIDGDRFESVEANPMIGYRGCYRYVREPDLFALELEALARARTEAPNIHLMIPFVRTAWELETVFGLVNASPLGADRRLQRWIMAEVPSVVYWLGRYHQLGVHGVSIGSNDLTQLMLGVDRDSEAVAELFDESDEAVLDAIESIVTGAAALGMGTSLCGQAPSRDPRFARHLVNYGIDSISVDRASVDAVRASVASAEQRLLVNAARRVSAV
ncbi:MAG: phosphoenolpyruvate synthase [Acidimicrobiales bacterium]